LLLDRGFGDGRDGSCCGLFGTWSALIGSRTSVGYSDLQKGKDSQGCFDPKVGVTSAGCMSALERFARLSLARARFCASEEISQASWNDLHTAIPVLRLCGASRAILPIYERDACPACLPVCHPCFRSDATECFIMSAMIEVAKWVHASKCKSIMYDENGT
jgi:hypothetical protein